MERGAAAGFLAQMVIAEDENVDRFQMKSVIVPWEESKPRRVLADSAKRTRFPPQVRVNAAEHNG